MKTDNGDEHHNLLDGQRRRLTRIPQSRYSSNGSFESDLALAVQESLRYAKLAEKKRQEESCEDKISNIENKMDTKSDVINKNCDQQIKQLKDLLLAHIDLVQHQQEMILQKDKEIKGLKEERNALSCRLERMERRVSLLKQREESEIQHPKKQGVSACVKNFKSTADRENRQVQEHLERPTLQERLLKRKAAFEPQNLTKKFASDVNTRSKNINVKNVPKPVSPAKRSARHSCVSVVNEEHIPIESESRRKIVKRNCDNTVLRTKDPYFVSYFEPSSQGDVDLEPRADIVGNAEAQLQVEVPLWRQQKYTNLYVLEGTENLEDEIFLKRHQKPEIEEKRRKRWDLQRLRDQTAYEKLKTKKEKANSCPNENDTEEVESFYADLDEITHIEVVDEIPVMAFGHALPSLQESEFEIPWEPEIKQKPRHSRSSGRSKQR